MKMSQKGTLLFVVLAVSLALFFASSTLAHAQTHVATASSAPSQSTQPGDVQQQGSYQGQYGDQTTPDAGIGGQAESD